MDLKWLAGFLLGGGLLSAGLKKMLNTLVLARYSKPVLSKPILVKGQPDDGHVRLGIFIRNLPYEGLWKRWVHQWTEERVSVDFTVLQDGQVVTIGYGGWENGDRETSIPPSKGREAGGQCMWLFYKLRGSTAEFSDLVRMTGIVTEGLNELPQGDYEVKLTVVDTEARSWNYGFLLHNPSGNLDELEMKYEVHNHP